MKKKITKEQIIETALELMRNKDDLRRLNLREIARTLGCAHTNLYNYFPSYNDLLWETHIALLGIFIDILIKKVETINTAELRLSYFFGTFVDMYLDNKGWFRLAWHEYLGEERPEQDIKVTEKTNEALTKQLSDIWEQLTGKCPDAKKIKSVLHNVHCYIIGEISNHILGRGLIENESELKTHIKSEAVNMFKLCLIGGDIIEF